MDFEECITESGLRNDTDHRLATLRRSVERFRRFCEASLTCPSLVLALGFFGLAPVVWAAGPKPPTELRKLYALLVVDTNSGLGESVNIDGEHIEHLLVRGIPKERLDLTIFEKKDVTAAKILNYYKTRKIGPSDALLLFYAGHGATDPQKGHWLALQELETKPLLRHDLLAAMKQRGPGLVVLMTDCCSNRYKLPGPAAKKRPRASEPSQVDPVLSCLLLRHRGVVDITASTDNAAFGDDHDGGLFTRAFCACLMKGVSALDSNQDGFVGWSEAFPLIQTETSKNFSRWAVDARRRGEKVEQTTQKPRAFSLPDGLSSSLTLVNATKKVVRYQYRWEGNKAWESATLPAEGSRVHNLPAGKSEKEVPRLEVKFETGETGMLKVGKSYRYSDKKP